MRGLVCYMFLLAEGMSVGLTTTCEQLQLLIAVFWRVKTI
jgi:hypothetical protein